ncbi:MAG: histidine kinase [Chitinophagaceae bacterium]
MHSEIRIRLISIPLLALLITLLFNSFFFVQEGYSFWLVLLSNFIFTIMAVESCRLLLLWIRQYFGGLAATRQRLLISALLLLPLSPLIGITHLYIEKDLLFQDTNPKQIYDFLSVSGSSFFFLLIVTSAYEAAYYFERWKKALTEKEQLEKINLQTQLSRLQEQLQPHFLFNNLNTLLSLTEEAPERAGRFIRELSTVYRCLLRSTHQHLVPLQQELQFADAYLFLLKSRFENALQISMQIDPVWQDYYLPPLTLQLLVENAVKHNQVDQKNPLQLQIITTEEGRIIVRNTLKKRIAPSERMGLANLAAKYRLLQLPDICMEETTGEFVVTVPLLAPGAAATLLSTKFTNP